MSFDKKKKKKMKKLNEKYVGHEDGLLRRLKPVIDIKNLLCFGLSNWNGNVKNTFRQPSNSSLVKIRYKYNKKQKRTEELSIRHYTPLFLSTFFNLFNVANDHKLARVAAFRGKAASISAVEVICVQRFLWFDAYARRW